MTVRLFLAVIAIGVTISGQTRAADNPLLMAADQADARLIEGGRENAQAALTALRQAGADAEIDAPAARPVNDSIYIWTLYARAALAANDQLKRAEKAAGLAISAAPWSSSFYRLRLDIAAAMPEAQWDTARKAQARSDYAAYVSLSQPTRSSVFASPIPILRRDRTDLLSDSAQALALSDLPQDVCRFAGEMARRNRTDEIGRFLNPETAPYANSRARIVEMAPVLRGDSAWQDDGEDDGPTIYVSYVDIDNDGVPDLHVASDGYREECGFDIYFKGIAGSTTFGEEISLKPHDPGSCGGGLQAIRFRGTNYLRSGNWIQGCTASVGSDMAHARIARTCDDAVCIEVARHARTILKARETRRDAQLVYRCEECQPLEGVWSVDVKNDGKPILYVYRTTDNPRFPVSACFVKGDVTPKDAFKDGCRETAIFALRDWGYTDQGDSRTFLAFRGKTYILDFQTPTSDDEDVRNDSISISLIENGRSRRIGQVAITDPPFWVRIEPLSAP